MAKKNLISQKSLCWIRQATSNFFFLEIWRFVFLISQKSLCWIPQPFFFVPRWRKLATKKTLAGYCNNFLKEE
jgi:hypothetical protein